MRVLRVWAPAVVAAALWLASAGLEWLGRRSTSRPLGYVLDLLAPETVPVTQLTSPVPWGVVLGGLSALALAGAHAGLLAAVRVRRRKSPAVTTVAAYWMCAVVAGASVAAVPVVVAVVRALLEQSMPTGFAGAHLVTVAHWGLVWGWVPALVARALDDDAGPRSRTGIAASAALLYLAAAIGLVVATGPADAARVAAIPSQPEPEPAPTGSPVPAVAPGQWQLDPSWCTSGQLEFSAGAVDPALGARAMPVHATNVADAPCVLEGYPDVAFSDPLTAALDVTVDHGGNTVVEDQGVQRVELAPGERAVAVLGWRAPAASAVEPAGWLHVAAQHGAERELVRVDTDITGGTVSVTAWELGTDVGR